MNETATSIDAPTHVSVLSNDVTEPSGDVLRLNLDVPLLDFNVPAHVYVTPNEPGVGLNVDLPLGLDLDVVTTYAPIAVEGNPYAFDVLYTMRPSSLEGPTSSLLKMFNTDILFSFQHGPAKYGAFVVDHGIGLQNKVFGLMVMVNW